MTDRRGQQTGTESIFCGYLLRCWRSIYCRAGWGFWIGNLIGGKELRNTLTFISSSRNLQIVLAVVILNFSPLATVPIIIATIFHNIMNAFWLWALQKN